MHEIGKLIITVLSIVAFVTVMTSCVKKGPAQKAGEKIDQTVDKAGKKIDHAFK